MKILRLMLTMTQTKSGACALCRKTAELRTSHMVPSFVGKWLKKTSATGFLSRSDDLSQRVQDLTKPPFLCENCEQIFSRLESHFAKTIWFPFQEKGIKSFKLDVRLELFGLSLGWRTLNRPMNLLRQELQNISDKWIRPRKIGASGSSEVRSKSGPTRLTSFSLIM